MISWVALLQTLKIGIDFLKEAPGFFSKIYLYIMPGKKILLFGLSGSGKSQFIESLEDNILTASPTFVPIKIKLFLKKFKLVFIDTPGMHEQRDMRIKEIKKVIKNKAEGIINIVSYGFIEKHTDKKSIAFDENGKLKNQYLLENRQEELNRLDEWMKLLDQNEVKWVITLVNKADLWWDEESDVHQFYELGPYKKHFLQEFDKKMNSIVIPYCSVIKPYFGVRTSGLLGENEKRLFIFNFRETLTNLIKNGK